MRKKLLALKQVRPFTERANRQKANVYVEHFFDNGHSAKAGVYGASKIFGGHASFTLTDSLGSTTLEGKLRRPDWDYSETVIYNGTRDTVALNRILNLTENFEIEAEGGFNNYNVDGIDNIAQFLPRTSADGLYLL